MFRTPQKNAYGVTAIESALHIMDGFKDREEGLERRGQFIHTKFPNGRFEFYLNFIELGNYLDGCWVIGKDIYGPQEGVFDADVSYKVGSFMVDLLNEDEFCPERVKDFADNLLKLYFGYRGDIEQAAS